ncbi:MAG TPA: urease accessory UreF family protein [Verrucomicrobiae bacterium]
MKQNEEIDDWLLWQLVDSAFPTGGFAHSGGLEAAWQHGEIRDSDGLASFLESSMWQMASGIVPYVMAAHDAPVKFSQLNELCDAFLSNHVANRASRVQGRAFLNSAARIFGPVARLEMESSFSHFAPAFGAVTPALGVDRRTTGELFAFQGFRGLISAAVRLGIVGPMEGQALQHRLAPRVREMLSSTVDQPVSEVAVVAPLLEIWQGSHDRLYSRLFQS